MSAWSALSSARGLRALAAHGAAVTVAAAAGGRATRPRDHWYEDLEKPPWQPPPATFGLVWTPLYFDIAAATAAAATSLEDAGRHEHATALRRSLAVNLVLNAGWSVVFWRVRRPWLATAWCAVLTAHSVGLTRRVGAVDPSLGRTLAPYPAWCGFATALNAAIARRNP